MSLAFAFGAAVVAAACGWPGSAVIERFGDRADAGPVQASPLASPWLISLLLAAAAFGVAIRLHPALVAAAACWLAICGAPLAVIDLRVRRLPDALTWACAAGIAALLIAAATRTAGWHDLARAGAGALALGAFFGLLALARPGAAGLGDAKFGLSIGALTGWLGWWLLVASVFAAFLLAAVAGLWLVATRRATLRDTSLPFGPFLLAGCLGVVLLAGVGHGDYVAALL